MENEIKALGFTIKEKIPILLSRSKADIVECTPFFDPYGNSHDAHFCFGYGVHDCSFSSLNYRNDYKNCVELGGFLKKAPILLGNFGVGIDAPASSLHLYPPPEIEVAGIAEVASAKKSSVIVWLGVRYKLENCDQSIVDEVSLRELDGPIDGGVKPATYVYGSVFSQQFAGGKYDLNVDEERELRMRLGYPARGKPIREQILYESACAIFGGAEVIRRYRGKELEGLELDVWVPSRRIGFEYQGAQHYKRLSHWQSAGDFASQQARDKKKKTLCESLGIHLIYFDANDDVDREGVIDALRFHRII